MCLLDPHLYFPAATQDLYPAYRVWRGLKYFWGPQGPAILGHFPEATQSDDGRDSALCLKQTHIDKFRTVIIQNLKRRVQGGGDWDGHAT